MKFTKGYGIGSEQSARQRKIPSLTVDVCSVFPHLMETEAVTSPLNALNQGLLS